MGKRKEQKEEPLNLVPIMNLVTILIPVLLVAIKSVELSIIDTTLPPINTNASVPDQNDENKPLELKLRVSNKGIWICGADDYIDVTDPKCEAEGFRKPDVSCGGGLCKSTSDYDWKSLKSQLKSVKNAVKDKKNEGCESVTFEPTSNVRYETLVKMMDVSREDKDVTEQLTDCVTGVVKKDEEGLAIEDYQQLFPKVVMSAVQSQK